jgi:glycosyltransferase involved in cell wall biosynthesis
MINNKINKVVVLLSTYNGGKYLLEQLESIVKQENVGVELIVRDDGSTDNSLEIVKRYTDLISTGENIGYLNSYIKLIQDAPQAKYYALADQDDIWFPEKLSTAIKFIKKYETEKPILYSCDRVELKNGKIYKRKKKKFYKNIGFSGFLNGYQLQACSMVFNYKLKKLIECYTPIGLTCAQDTWLQQVCKVNNGIVIYDKVPHFIYRIHEKNTLGLPKYRVIKKMRELLSKNKKPFSDIICKNLLEGYSLNMSDEIRKTCSEIARYKERKIKILFNRKYYKGDIMQNILLLMQILAGNA